MRRIFQGTAVALVLSGFLFTGPANLHAQSRWWDDDDMMYGGMMNGRMMHGRMMMGMMNGPMLQGRLAYVRAELGITEAQTSAWNAYSDAVNAQIVTMQGMHDTMKQVMQSGTALERMDLHIQAMETMTGALKTLKPAIESLYKTLTPEQKQKADVLLSVGGMM